MLLIQFIPHENLLNNAFQKLLLWCSMRCDFVKLVFKVFTYSLSVFAVLLKEAKVVTFRFRS